MSASEFYDDVAQLADLPSGEEGARVTSATLRTLGRHVSEGEAEDLARHVPVELRDELTGESDEEPEGFDVDQFVARVEDRAGDLDEPQRAIQAVMAALADRGARNELGDAMSQLPPEFEALFDTGELTPTEGVDPTDDV
jgi:uncharacterized protein (DUF2267 family)